MTKSDILCAVDFSASSINALEWAVDVAKKTHSKLTIMFCYRLIAAFDDEDTLDLKKNMEKDARLKFKELEKQYIKGQPFPYTFTTEVGFYHFRIEMFVRINPVGLIVLGSSIVQQFDENKNLGFDAFLKASKVPVVVVPNEARV